MEGRDEEVEDEEEAVMEEEEEAEVKEAGEEDGEISLHALQGSRLSIGQDNQG